MRDGLTRRSFLRRAAASGAGVGLVVLPSGRSARTYAANNKLNVALIGIGGRGRHFVEVMPKLESVVAFCDVNEKRGEAALKAHPKMPKFRDFRVMLDKMGKQIDAVTVAVPDHSHAMASVTAMKAGKHVLCEKPLARTVEEARVMREIARRQKIATVMGNQGSAAASFRRGVEILEDGLMGEVRHVFSWNAWGGRNFQERPSGKQKIPYYLNWDLWLGPAAYRDFHRRWMAWGHWRDFGTGQLGNWGSHATFLAFMGMKVKVLWSMPPEARPRIRVRAEVSGINRLSFPTWEAVHFGVPAREKLPPVTFHWVNGAGATKWRERIEDHLGRKLRWEENQDGSGSLIVGAKAVMLTSGHGSAHSFVRRDRAARIPGGDPKRYPLAPDNDHDRDWLRYCRGGPPTLANFANTGPYLEFLLLANVATQFDAELEYDPLAGRVVNHAEADALLRPERRKGWSL